jgi:hypothetical protein
MLAAASSAQRRHGGFIGPLGTSNGSAAGQIRHEFKLCQVQISDGRARRTRFKCLIVGPRLPREFADHCAARIDAAVIVIRVVGRRALRRPRRGDLRSGQDPLFRSAARRTGRLTALPMHSVDACWSGDARPRPASKGNLAAMCFARPASPPASKPAASSRMPRPWPRTSKLALS